jgi:hypothetical protein
VSNILKKLGEKLVESQATQEKSRCRIRNPVVRIRRSGSISEVMDPGTLVNIIWSKSDIFTKREDNPYAIF